MSDVMTTRDISIAFFTDASSTSPTQRTMSVDMMEQGCLRSTKGLSPVQADDVRKVMGRAFSPATYKPNTKRGKENVESLCAYVMDFDYVTPEQVDEIFARLEGYRHWGWTTWGSGWAKTPQAWRVVVPFSVDVPAGVWPGMWLILNDVLGGGQVDPATKDASRLHFLPRAPAMVPDGEGGARPNDPMQWRSGSGALFDPSEYLEDAAARCPPRALPMPAWAPDFGGGAVGNAWKETALREICDELASAAPGTRNAAVCRLAFKAGQLLVDGGEQALWRVTDGWGNVEADRKKVATQYRLGQAHPRRPREQAQAPALIGEITCSTDEPVEVTGQHRKPVSTTEAARLEEQSQWDLLQQVRDLGGLCDSFAGWVIGNAPYPQPALTVGAVLALGAACSARRWTYQGQTGNLYVVAIADTSFGKDRPAACVATVLNDLWPGAVGPNDFSSFQATRQLVGDAAGAGTGLMFVLDEYGAKLQWLLDEKSTYQKELRAFLLEANTIKTRTYVGAQSLARGGQSVKIVAPGVSIFGPTTPDTLHKAIGRAGVADGFLGRHVCVAQLPELPLFHPVKTVDPIPRVVVEGIAAVRADHEAWHKSLPPLGSSDDGRPLLLYQPQEVEDDGGGEILLAFHLRNDEVRRVRAGASDAPRELLGRAAEMARRISIGFSVLRAAAFGAAPVVDRDVARCAVAVVQHSIAALSTSVKENAAENDWERKIQQFRGAIRETARDDAWSEWTAFRRRCQGIRTREADEIAAQLLSSGALEAKEERTGGRPVRLVRLLDGA